MIQCCIENSAQSLSISYCSIAFIKFIQLWGIYESNINVCVNAFSFTVSYIVFEIMDTRILCKCVRLNNNTILFVAFISILLQSAIELWHFNSIIAYTTH